MHIQRRLFGHTVNQEPVNLFTLSNNHGLEIKITNYGGTVVSILAPDRDGNFGEVTLGFDNLEQYIDNSPYFGCLVGRYANRIAKGKFMLNGIAYNLAQNNGENHLHGGLKGFDKVVWQAAEFSGEDQVGLVLTYQSPDGEENYPGTLDLRVIYTLNNDNALKIEYFAAADQDTVLNLTNHTYFNLAGAGDILGHVLTLNAARFTPIDETLIPTGELRSVSGTPMDFTTAAIIGERIEQDDPQLNFAGGYDHNWVLNKADDGLVLAAAVFEPFSGRVLETYTTQPGIQFYSGNFLDGSLSGPDGIVYDKRSGFCLETQHFPDSPNQPHFPSTNLKPGEQYRQTTIYKFSALAVSPKPRQRKSGNVQPLPRP
jgi:aldose 1-epimerase